MEITELKNNAIEMNKIMNIVSIILNAKFPDKAKQIKKYKYFIKRYEKELIINNIDPQYRQEILSLLS